MDKGQVKGEITKILQECTERSPESQKILQEDNRRWQEQKMLENGMIRPTMEGLDRLSLPFRAIGNVIQNLATKSPSNTHPTLQRLHNDVALMFKCMNESDTSNEWKKYRQEVTTVLQKNTSIDVKDIQHTFDSIEEIAVGAGLWGGGSGVLKIARSFKKIPPAPKENPCLPMPPTSTLPGVYWHGANEGPELYFANGFVSKGTNLKWRQRRSSQSGYIFTADNARHASWYPNDPTGRTSWIYEIHSNRITCLEKHKPENHFLFKRYIHNHEIKAAWEMDQKTGNLLRHVENTRFGVPDPLMLPKEPMRGVYFRGVNEGPEVYFLKGFVSKGTNFKWNQRAGSDSGLIFTSNLAHVARRFPCCTPKYLTTWVYEIHSHQLPCHHAPYSHFLFRRIHNHEVKSGWEIDVATDKIVRYVENPHFISPKSRCFVGGLLPCQEENAGLPPGVSLTSEDVVQQQIVNDNNERDPEEQYPETQHQEEQRQKNILEEEQGVTLTEALVDYAGQATGIRPALDTYKEVVLLLDNLSKNPDAVPLQLISQILKQPMSSLESICNFRGTIAEQLRAIANSNSLAQLGAGCMVAAGTILTFMNSVSWICEFTKNPKQGLRDMLLSPYHTVKNCYKLGMSFLKNPVSTAKMFCKSLLKFPEQTVKRFLRAVGLKKRKKKHKQEVASPPSLSPEELQRLREKYIQDLEALYFLARSKGFVDPFLTLEEYHNKLVFDWTHGFHSTESYFDFPLFLAHKMEQNSLFVICRYSPTAHPNKPVFFPELLQLVDEISTYEWGEICGELQEARQDLNIATTSSPAVVVAVTKSNELKAETLQQQTKLLYKELEQTKKNMDEFTLVAKSCAQTVKKYARDRHSKKQELADFQSLMAKMEAFCE
jgi:hypothetical protein